VGFHNFHELIFRDQQLLFSLCRRFSFSCISIHFSVLQGNIEKLKEQDKKREELKSEEEEKKSGWALVRERVERNNYKTKKRVGKISQKRKYDKNALVEVEFTRGIHLAYFLAVIGRIIVELVFLILAYDLFRFGEYPNEPDDGRIVSDGRVVGNFFDLFWIRVPQLYRCNGRKVSWACGQHLLPGNDAAYVPCWVSRPWEKTIFLRYMNSFSLLCLILSIIEMILLLVRLCKVYRRKQKKFKRAFSPEKSIPPAEPNQYMSPPDVPVSNEPALEQQVTKPLPQQPSDGTKAISSEPLQVALTSKKRNVFDDIATGKISVEQLRYNLRQENEKDQPKKRRSSRQTRFVIPTGTQSLNRPKKMLKTQYQPLFKMGKISFSESEGENDDGGGSSSSGETQLSSVSQQSVGEV